MKTGNITAKQHTQIKWAIDMSLGFLNKNRQQDAKYAFRCEHCESFSTGTLQDLLKFISVDHAGHTTIVGASK